MTKGKAVGRDGKSKVRLGRVKVGKRKEESKMRNKYKRGGLNEEKRRIENGLVGGMLSGSCSLNTVLRCRCCAPA